ncbi:MAG: pyridoxal 5'-phosphate synthase glutaminase subunit PdxT [Calditrichia bacterium]
MTVGILALQGDFELHKNVLDALQIKNILVKSPRELKSCDGLIIPGGETTTFMKLLRENNLYEELIEFGKSKYIFGTCAGLITVSRKVNNHSIEALDLIDIEVKRNAYGRQIDSFIGTVQILLNNNRSDYEGVFIRAPKILKIGEGVKPIGYHQEDIVLVENENILAATFHPELTKDYRIHEYFLQKIKKQ